MNISRYDRSTLALVIAILIAIFIGWGFISSEYARLRSKVYVLQEKALANKKLVKEHEKKIEYLQSIINEISNVTVKGTSYNAVIAQTDSTPDETACGVKPRVGSIAVSQDLFYKGWTCGKWVKIKRLGVFEITQVLDVMHYRKTKQIDIVKATEEEALQFGVVTGLNAVLLTNYEKMQSSRFTGS
jgi:3D (Asp-Asp-Asp) domain-containing protein